MPGQPRTNCTAGAMAANFRKIKFATVALLSVAALLLTGWRDPPPSAHMPDPADPRAPVPPVGYGSTIRTYKRQRPVEPGAWREQNQRVTPQPKTGL